jgi:predicted transcriptional regulator
MIEAHIHRVIVVDERDQPIGIVSSTDILGAVAQADSQYSPL